MSDTQAMPSRTGTLMDLGHWRARRKWTDGWTLGADELRLVGDVPVEHDRISAQCVAEAALPWQFFTALVLFTIVYLLLVEMMKTVFYAAPMHLAAAPHRTRGRELRIHRRAARFSHASRIAHPPGGPAPLPTSVPGS